MALSGGGEEFCGGLLMGHCRAGGHVFAEALDSTRNSWQREAQCSRNSSAALGCRWFVGVHRVDKLVGFVLEKSNNE